MRIKVLLITLLTIGEVWLSHAQQYLNLGLEYQRSPGVPAMWDVVNGTLQWDSTICSEKPVVRLTGDSAHQYCVIRQTFNDLSGMTGKTLEFRCQAQYGGQDTSKMLMPAVCLKNEDILSGANGDSLTGVTGWHDLSVRIDVADSTTAVVFGMSGLGIGPFYLKDFEILIDGIPYRDFTPRRDSLSPRERKWLDRHAVRFDSLTVDFPAIGRAVGDSWLVGLGENTHGSGSVATVRGQLAEYLIREKGFTLLALENSPNVIEPIDRFVQTGEGRPDSLLRSTFGWSCNREFADLILWIREYNKHAEKKVRIEGIDMQNPRGALRRLNAMSNGQFHSSDIHPLDSMFRHVESKQSQLKYYTDIQITEDLRTTVMASTSRLRRWAEDNLSDPATRDRFVWYTEIIEQFLEPGIEARNRFMAENIARLHSRSPSEKVIFFAHNTHVGKGKSVMGDRETGDWLCERFGSDYYVIGTCFNRGAYLAGNIYNDRYMNVYAFPGMPGSYEYMFGSMGRPRFFLNWRGVRQNNDNAWLFHPMLLRSTGSQWGLNEFYPVPLTERFDAVVFIEESEPITSYYHTDQ